MSKEIIRIRWHGRGGQGAITAAKIVANAAFESGFKGIVMVPSFGTERRGAPISTSLKLSKETINDLSPTESPDIVIVLDPMILSEVDVTHGLKPGGLLILNTHRTIDQLDFKNLSLAVSDITGISSQVGLKRGIVNSGIIGAFAKASGLLDIDILVKHIEAEFQGKKPQENGNSAKMAFEQTIIGEK